MSSGLKIRNRCFLLLLLAMQLLSSCQKKAQRRIEFSAGEPFQILMNDTVNVDVKWYGNGFLKSITTKDKSGVKNGPQLEYHPNGVLKERYSWKNGKITGEYWAYNDRGEKISYHTYVDGEKNGDTYEFSHDSFVRSHILFQNGNAIYIGTYGDGKKYLSSPFPVFEDEKIRDDDIYEARIIFPFQFKGELEIFLRDTIDFKKEYLDKYNLNLTITNFDRSWKKYDLLLEYEPAEDDSLVWTEQVYGRTIDIK